MSLETTWRTAVGAQFGAALDMLEDAVLACPDALWGERGRQPEFWYLVFHTLFWADYYLAGSERGFTPPAPYTLAELDPAGVMPERVYAKDELVHYLGHVRGRLRTVLATLTDEDARARCGFERRAMSTGELLLYNLRHVQHHAAQLHLILRQVAGATPGWVSRARDAGARP